ncbi:MAG: sulfur carrier protein ThiS [Rikenellaceae bacterium]
MNIKINSQDHIFSGKLLSELIIELNIGDGGYAIAVGKSIIPRPKHTETVLQEGDEITIIGATHGG